MRTGPAAFAFLLAAVPFVLSQRPRTAAPANAPPSPTFEEHGPRAMLVVEKHEIKRAKYPVIDVHTHQRDPAPEKIGALLRDMDSLNMRVIVSSPVSGSFGTRTKTLIEA